MVGALAVPGTSLILVTAEGNRWLMAGRGGAISVKFIVYGISNTLESQVDGRERPGKKR
jgi:hypothetical protein